MAIAPDPFRSDQRRDGDPFDIGRQLHDIVVPQLFVLTTGLAALQRQPDRADDGRLVDDLVETSAQVLDDLRAISRGRTPERGGSLGQVVRRLEDATHSVAQLSGCDVRVHVDDTEVWLDAELDQELRAVAWEAIANAIRHGRARRIDVSVTAPADHLTVVVVDDGEWRPVDPAGTGLDGLRRRAEARGGRFAVDHDGATRLEWAVPVPPTPTVTPPR